MIGMMQVNLRGNIVSLFSKRKKILAIGCSYTDHWYGEKYGFSTWPEILADKLDMHCYNYGKAGSGNNYIFEKMYDKIYEEEFDLVVLMWSEFQRLDFQWHGKGWLSLHPHRIKTLEKYAMNISGKRSLLKYANIHSMTQHSLRLFHLTQTLLKDIPYIMVQGTRCVCAPIGFGFDQSDGYWRVLEKECIESMLKSPYIDKIDEDKFLGFPLLRPIGGWDMDTVMDKLDPDRKKYRIGGPTGDTHPNEEGHKYMAGVIYDAYQKLYS